MGRNVHDHRDPTAKGDDWGHDSESNMTIKEAKEFGKELPERHVAFGFRNEEFGADIGDIGSAVVPATHLDKLSLDGFPKRGVDDSILINGNSNGEDRVVTAEEEQAAPVLMTILYDGAFGPEVHSFEGLEWLRMAGKVA